MATLNKPSEEPPDGWIYTQQETGGRFKAGTLHKLAELVVEHRQWRMLARATYDEAKLDVQRQICLGMPPGVCTAEMGEDYQPFLDQMRSITMEQMMDFSRASFRFIESGGQLVPKAESARRAEICRGCRFNRPSPCVVCTPVFKMIDAMIPADRKEPGLSACGVCGCSLRPKFYCQWTPSVTMTLKNNSDSRRIAG